MFPHRGTTLTASRAAAPAGKSPAILYRSIFGCRLQILLRLNFGLIFPARPPSQHDNSPEAPAASGKEGPVPSHADHKTKAGEDSPAHATHSSGPRSLSPSAGSQDSLPTPRSHLVPETTTSSLSSSCQNVPSGAQAVPASLQPLFSTEAHPRTASSSPVGPAPPGLPPLSLTLGADARRVAGQDREDRETPRPHPLPCMSAERAGTPSPPFGPQRLTDRPPGVLVQDDSAPR